MNCTETAAGASLKKMHDKTMKIGDAFFLPTHGGAPRGIDAIGIEPHPSAARVGTPGEVQCPNLAVRMATIPCHSTSPSVPSNVNREQTEPYSMPGWPEFKPWNAGGNDEPY